MESLNRRLRVQSIGEMKRQGGESVEDEEVRGERVGDEEMKDEM